MLDAKDATRPIVGIENRTGQEVFDIMCDRFRRALQAVGPEPAVADREKLNSAVDAVFAAVIDCPHEIEAESITLRFSPNKGGHNALFQLSGRIRSALVATPPAGGDDWTVDDTLTAREILDYLGIGSDASLEPYADRRRDAVAKIIQKRVATTPPAEQVVEAMPLREIRRRVRNIWGAISSNQVIDKDVEGQAKRLLADIDVALAAKDGRS